MAEIDREELEILLESGGRSPHLTGWDLSGLDLRGLDLRRANLEGSNLENADLRDVDLTEANLKDVNLRGARLDNASLPIHFRLDGLPGEFRVRLEKAGMHHRKAVQEALREGDSVFLEIQGIGPATLQAVKDWLAKR